MSNVVPFGRLGVVETTPTPKSVVEVDIDDFGIHVRVVPPMPHVNPHVIFWKEHLAGAYVEYLRETHGFAVRWPDEGGAA